MITWLAPAINHVNAGWKQFCSWSAAVLSRMLCSRWFSEKMLTQHSLVLCCFASLPPIWSIWFSCNPSITRISASCDHPQKSAPLHPNPAPPSFTKATKCIPFIGNVYFPVYIGFASSHFPALRWPNKHVTFVVNLLVLTPVIEQWGLESARLRQCPFECLPQSGDRCQLILSLRWSLRSSGRLVQTMEYAHPQVKVLDLVVVSPAV